MDYITNRKKNRKKGEKLRHFGDAEGADRLVWEERNLSNERYEMGENTSVFRFDVYMDRSWHATRSVVVSHIRDI